MIPAFLLPLLGQGLDLVANAAMVKGKDWIEQKTGLDLDTARLSPENVIALKQFELTHEKELLQIKHEENKLSKEYAELYSKDLNSARDMQKTAIQSDDKFVSRFVYMFAIAWSILAAGYVFGITFYQVPEDNIRFADTVLGFLLGTIIAQIIAFFYGSSRSSQGKDSTIDKTMSELMRLRNVDSKR